MHQHARAELVPVLHICALLHRQRHSGREVRARARRGRLRGRVHDVGSLHSRAQEALPRGPPVQPCSLGGGHVGSDVSELAAGGSRRLHAELLHGLSDHLQALLDVSVGVQRVPVEIRAQVVQQLLLVFFHSGRYVHPKCTARVVSGRHLRQWGPEARVLVRHTLCHLQRVCQVGDGLLGLVQDVVGGAVFAREVVRGRGRVAGC
mmetsp:Transcript_28380/g.72275  ORF Transcript_28380/g.72275 Transcript_28380/m.72275 type:complete len:205 (-) Transcript_28380:65-679(-)